MGRSVFATAGTLRGRFSDLPQTNGRRSSEAHGTGNSTASAGRRYACGQLQRPLPLLFKPVFPEDQDPVFNQYPGVVTGHAALMNDLGTGPNHGLLQQAAILLTAGAKTDVLDFHAPDTTLRRGWRITSEVAEQSLVPAQQRASAGWGPQERCPPRLGKSGQWNSSAAVRCSAARPPARQLRLLPASGCPVTPGLLVPHQATFARATMWFVVGAVHRPSRGQMVNMIDAAEGTLRS